MLSPILPQVAGDFQVSSSQPPSFLMLMGVAQPSPKPSPTRCTDGPGVRRRRLGFAHLQAYAEQIGLDVPRFSADVIDGRFLARIRAQTRSGVGSGVQSTPTVFLNGWRLDPLMDPRWIIDDVRSAVRALEHSRSLVVPV